MVFAKGSPGLHKWISVVADVLKVVSARKVGVSLFQIRRQHIFDPFHECADSARQIAPMCYDEGDGERPATKIGYDLHKRSNLQVSAMPQERRLNQAKAGEGGGFVGLRAVDV